MPICFATRRLLSFRRRRRRVISHISHPTSNNHISTIILPATEMTPEPPSEQELRSCEKRIAKALDSSPLIKILLKGMQNAGCVVNPARHFACENCSGEIAGGFDVRTNQVVICANQCRTEEKVEQILSHELVHMYDFCTAQIDFANVDHLACTEVRAANLAHCRFLGGEGGFLASRESCVRERAAKSVSVIKGLSHDLAMKAVDKVFDKCYRDQEPIGRYTYSRQCEFAAMSDFISVQRICAEEKDKKQNNGANSTAS